MNKNQRLLILPRSESTGRSRLTLGLDRKKILSALAAEGAKVRHDSGGRFILVELPKRSESALARRLPDARLVELDAGLADAAGDLDPTEALFIEAIRIRASPKYRAAKRRRKVGDTPEEQRLVSGACVREDY